VLIVDDNPQLVGFIADALQELGDFQVATATDGAQGLERYYVVRPDCMVIDVRMPGLDGYQLVRALRGDAETAHVPLILLTALAQDMDRFAGLVSGADDYLVKPVKPQDLIAAIERAIALGEEARRQRMRQLSVAELDEPR
jgi:DNA-binding response OmpR family regulator